MYDESYDNENDEFDADEHKPESSESSTDEAAVDADLPSFGELGDAGEAIIGQLENVQGYELDPTGSILSADDKDQDESLWLDAWYASFSDENTQFILKKAKENAQPIFQEVVIGSDDRVQINATSSYPWRAICSLRIRAKDGSNWIGTGWLVGPRTVVTAGHCVYMHDRGGWADNIEVIPGRNGASKPYGSATSSSFRSVKGWTSSRKRNYDYGVIQLPSNQALGSKVGWFGYANYSSNSLKNMVLNLSGYPGDKPVGTQWFMARRASGVSSRVITYQIDTAGGQSGSPVWRLVNGKRYAVGIHTNGSSSGNSATRIAKPVFNNIKAWKSQVEMSAAETDQNLTLAYKQA